MLECSHCLLSFPEREAVHDEIDGTALSFCCNGCRGIYRLIHDEGLDRFYDKRSWDQDAAGPSLLAHAPEASLFEPLIRDFAGGGNDLPLKEIEIYVGNIRCASCIWLNERILTRTEGVAHARLNYATHMARIRWNPEVTGLDAILGRIASIGYLPKPYTETERHRAQTAEAKDLLLRFGTAAFLSSNLMIYSAALYAGYFQGLDRTAKHTFELISMLLTIPVLFYSGMPFIRSTLRGLRSLHFTMDSLIAVGSVSAFVYSVYCLFTGGEVYFDTAAMIVTLILLGRYIETTAKGKASMTIQMLSELVPWEARKLRRAEDAAGGEDAEMVPVSSIVKGDRLLVKPGERIPVDGTVVSGESEVDESVITGESRPVAKTAGVRVIGGSMNLFGSIAFEAEATERDSLLARIIQSVADAQATKAPIQNVADRVVAVFVPAIILMALLTAGIYLFRGAPVSQALMTGISVLVIACPCSLGLSTPLAVLICSTIASSRGILIKGGEVIENVVKVTGIVFDKTGTITTGKPVLTQTVVLDTDIGAEELLRIAAAVERYSEHSAGHAIVEAARGLETDAVEGFKAVPGKGVEGAVRGRPVLVGNRRYLSEAGITVGEGVLAAIAAYEDQGHTAVFIGWEARLRGYFLIADTVRSDAADAVGRLSALGLRTSIISGDTVATTRAIGTAVGVHEATGGALPQQKRELVARMQQEGGRIMMIGDGINDAPALTEAFVGIGMGRGTEIAMESADAVLVRNRLHELPFLLTLCRKTFGIIKQNIFWAFFYNIAAIPLAVSGVLHPIVAAGIMSVSSLFVVFNSLRIRKCGRSIS